MAIISIGLTSSSVIEGESTNVEFDGLITVTPTIPNTVTRRPVEDGFDTNDAVHNGARTADVQIIITDTAQSILDKRAITNLANITGVKLLKSYTKKQLSRLEKISDNRELIYIKTKYNTFKDYYIENITYPETADDALVINFTIVQFRTNAEEETSNIDDSVGVFS